MRATPLQLRLLVRYFAAQAISANATFVSTLQAAAFGTVNTVVAGKLVIEAESSGTLTRYELPPGVGGLTPFEIAEAFSYLLDVHDRGVAPTTVQYPNGLFGQGLSDGVGANDAALVAWMLSPGNPSAGVPVGPLWPIRSTGSDFTNPQTRW